MAEKSRATASPEPTPADHSTKEPQETEVAPHSSEAAEGAKSGEADRENAEEDTGMGNDTEESRVQETGDDGAHEGANAGDKASDTRSQSKKSKRKSTSGIPEHRARKVNKKKSQPVTHIDAKPGDYYLARMKGHPAWPAIICDDEMLPPAILSSRGVSARRPDGSFREDYADGGKRVNERTFPVMFLATNEFAWIVNTDLADLDVDAIESQPKRARKGAIDEAFKIAAEKHDLAWFKNMLAEHEEALAAEAEAEEEQEEEPEEDEKVEPEAKKSKGKKRKSKAATEEVEDVEMEDADQMEFEEDEPEPEKKSKSKKRKKDVDSDGEGSKPAKTPKRADTTKKTTKLKLSTPKTPNGAAASKSASKGGSTAKAAKSKSASAKKEAKKAQDDAEEESPEGSTKPEEKQLSVAEQREKRKKNLLYLRHKLQKGFLMRDQPPKEEDMAEMADYITKLESYDNLEVSMIRTTKINKVLKGIVKLSSIPKDEEFKFRQRSYDLIQTWNQLFAKEPETPTAGASTEENGAGVNGTGKADKSDDDKAEKEDTVEVEKGDKDMEDAGDEAEKKTEATEDVAKSESVKADAGTSTSPGAEQNADDDTTMAEPTDAKDETTEKKGGDLGEEEDIGETAKAVEPKA